MDFFVSTMAENAAELARKYHLGLELADFCYAPFLDRDFEKANKACLEKQVGLDRFWFHAPFAELCPAAIDPEVRAIAVKRYRQAISVANSYGIHSMVIHSGFIPHSYFPEWFIPESIKFWKEFLDSDNDDITIALENVMDPTPDILTSIVKEVNDPRLGLCLDTGHANLTDTPLEKWVSDFVPYLRHVHLHSNNKDWDYHNALGTGTVDAEAILNELEHLVPNISITIEMMQPDSSVLWLRDRGWL